MLLYILVRTVFFADRGFQHSRLYKYFMEEVKMLLPALHGMPKQKLEDLLEKYYVDMEIDVLEKDKKRLIKENDIAGDLRAKSSNKGPSKDKARQQPTYLSNCGRLCTVVRFMIEHVLGILSKRYDIWHKIPRHVLPFAGIMMAFCKSVHIQFEIGKIKPSMDRLMNYEFMKMNMNRWPKDHPISLRCFLGTQQHLGGRFKEMKTPQDVMKKIGTRALDFIMTNTQIRIKGGGINNVKKMKQYTWASKDKIKLYCGKIKYEEKIWKVLDYWL